MPVRVALGDVSAWEIALSAGIALATTVALIRLAARVYAGGLLRTGARPGPRDVWRAVRGG
jgi:ABC-2 type transport system permease protein